MRCDLAGESARLARVGVVVFGLLAVTSGAAGALGGPPATSALLVDGPAHVQRRGATPPPRPLAAGVTARPAALRPLAPPAPRPPIPASGFDEKWRWVLESGNAGRYGLQVADIDGDGSDEILATADGYTSSAYAFVLRSAAGGYVQQWVIPGIGWSFVRAAQLDADPQLEVVAASAAQVRVFDGLTHAEEISFPVSTGALTGMQVGDVDADGVPEIVLIDSNDLYIYDLQTGALKAHKLGFGGLDLALGQIDGDAALEIGIAAANGSGLVLDGATLKVDWGRASGFGQSIAFGDVDGDGLDEVATLDGGSPYTVSVFSPHTDSLLYTVSDCCSSASALVLADVAGDSRAELIFASNGISVRDGLTGTELYHVALSGYPSLNAIAAGDPDGDDTKDIAVAGDGSGVAGQTLRIVDTVTKQVEWESPNLDGPFHALAVADVNNDGTPEVVGGSFMSQSGYFGGAYVVFAGPSGAVQYISTASEDDAQGMAALRTANIDGDPQAEICLVTSVGYTGRIACYDGLSHAEQWHVDLPDGLAVVGLALADVDGNGALDLVASTEVVSSDAPGNFAFAFTAADGLLLWRSPSLGGNWASWPFLRVAELDGDPEPEVVVANDGGQFVVLSGTTGLVKSSGAAPAISYLTAMATPDRDGDQVDELLVGTSDGKLLQLDPLNGNVLQTILDTGMGAIDGLAVGDLDGDGVDDYAYGQGTQLVVTSGKTLAPLFVSDPLGPDAGSWDGVEIAEVDGDRSPEIVVNMGPGVAVFDAPGPVLMTDGFESGDFRRWSGVEPLAAPSP